MKKGSDTPLHQRVRSLSYRTRYRCLNRWFDVRARLAGYCNDTPWRPEPDQGGGYSHWRCALRRRHDGLHRFRNYTWALDGRVVYSPMPNLVVPPSQPWDRSMQMTMRQQRARDR